MCHDIAEAVIRWQSTRIADPQEISLGTFGDYELRKDCEECQYVVRYLKSTPLEAFRSSCYLIFSRDSVSKRFRIWAVSFSLMLF